MDTYSVSGPARGNQSLHFIFFPPKTIRGLERSHSIVATLTSFVHETNIVRFELLEIEKRDLPTASTTTELTMLELPLGILSLTDERSV